MATYGIDYDETWTTDPGLWASFVRTAVGRGHTVVLVTNRISAGRWGREVRQALRLVPISGIVFAGAAPKRTAALQAGHRVDVWIDDAPRTVELGLEGTVAPLFWREPGVR